MKEKGKKEEASVLALDSGFLNLKMQQESKDIRLRAKGVIRRRK